VLESIPKKDKKEIAEKLKDATNDETNMQNLAAKLARQSASRLGLRSWPSPLGRAPGLLRGRQGGQDACRAWNQGGTGAF
jgi:hypothetical protein